MIDRQLAVLLRRAFVMGSTDAPEGIEFYRWYWLADRQDYMLQFPHYGADGTLSAVVVEPRAMVWAHWTDGSLAGIANGLVGWNERHRIAVLWHADGGLLPDWEPDEEDERINEEIRRRRGDDAAAAT